MDVGSLSAEAELRFAPAAGLVLAGDDPAALSWAREFFGPSLEPAAAVGGDRVVVHSAAGLYTELAAQVPADAAERPCFAFDQSMYLLPTVESERGLLAFDSRRSCVLVVRPAEVELVGDPASRRWRFTLVLVIHELAATRLRRNQLEIHASGVTAGGRTVLMTGPKGAGKTTLCFHLLRSGLVGWLANDRVFAGRQAGAGTERQAGAGPEANAIVVRGVPTALKVRPPTAAEFPELSEGIPAIERPYLYGAEEAMPEPEAEPRTAQELMLNPPQVARRLGAARTASAPLGTLLFPEVDPLGSGWSVEPLAPAEAAELIWSNLFGNAAQPRPPTVFEELAGGRAEPDRALAEAMAGGAAAFRVVLGRGAYEEPDFARRFLTAVGSGP
jgi:hypothetical protein